VRRELAAIDPRLPLYDVRTMRSRVDEQMAGNRFNTIVLTGFGLVALVLASLGVYGVLSYTVVQRRREIAVRVALGARQKDIIGMVLRRGGHMMVLGVGLGTSTALLLGRYLSSLLFEVSPLDPSMLALATTCSIAAALAASYLPARGAAGTDPMQVLRE
jgi:ABC-type antimicrobial peptide transport system permease subunit